MKLCRTCNTERPFVMFNKNKAEKDGLQTRCKDCWKVYHATNKEHLATLMRANYVANKSSRIANSKAAYEANKEAHSEYHKARYQRIKDSKKIAQAARYAENSAYTKARVSEYNKANPGKKTHWTAKRRAAQLQATPAWSDLVVIQAFYEDAKTLETIFGWPFHVDHIVPLNHPLVSGLHVPANLQILNASDNLSKSNTFHI